MIKKNAFIIAVAICINASYAQTAKVGVIGLDEANQFDSELEDNTPSTKEFQPPNIAQRLSLMEALEQGLRRNYEQKIREFSFDLLEIDYANDYEAFWFPSVNLVLNSGPTLIQKLSTDNSASSGTSGTPNGYFGLEFSDYTLFNWGRDYLQFLNEKANYVRGKQRLNEQRRQLRFNIIAQYFRVAMTKTVLRSRAELLRHSSFIYRLAREKLALKKISSQELLQAKEEYLKAMGEHREYLAQVLEEERELARLIGDDNTTTYQMTNELLFQTLNTSTEEAYKFVKKNNPNLLQADVDLANANRSFKKTLKDNLPLPRISMRLGAYRHRFGTQGVEDTFSTSDSLENRNVEVVASVNMTWSIFGNGGFLNSRTRESSYLNKKIAEVQLLEVKRDLQVTVSNLIRRINFLERRYESSQERLKNARQAFDKALDNYISGKTSFVNIENILEALRDSEYEFEDAKLNHLIYKLQLAELMGLENFPGQNFEQLVIQ